MSEKIDTAVVLAGGAGVRLKPLTNHIPKAMIKICGKPLLEWMVEWLVKNDVKNIILGVAYRKNKIIDYFRDGTSYGVNIKYSVHTLKGGTCQGFGLAIKRHITKQNFFAMNGDQIVDLDLSKVAALHLSEKPTATIVLTNPICPYGRITTNASNEVISFEEKPSCRMGCNSGIYIFNNKILDCIPPQGDMERITFPLLAKQKSLLGYFHDGLFLTVNTEKDLVYAEQRLSEIRNLK